MDELIAAKISMSRRYQRQFIHHPPTIDGNAATRRQTIARATALAAIARDYCLDGGCKCISTKNITARLPKQVEVAQKNLLRLTGNNLMKCNSFDKLEKVTVDLDLALDADSREIVGVYVEIAVAKVPEAALAFLTTYLSAVCGLFTPTFGKRMS